MDSILTENLGAKTKLKVGNDLETQTLNKDGKLNSLNWRNNMYAKETSLTTTGYQMKQKKFDDKKCVPVKARLRKRLEKYSVATQVRKAGVELGFSMMISDAVPKTC